MCQPVLVSVDSVSWCWTIDAKPFELSLVVFFLRIRRPPRSTLDRSSAASDVYKRQRVYAPEARGQCAHGCGVVALFGDQVISVEEGEEVGVVALLDQAHDLCGGVDQMRCLLYTSPSPRDRTRSRMPSSA